MAWELPGDVMTTIAPLAVAGAAFLAGDRVRRSGPAMRRTAATAFALALLLVFGYELELLPTAFSKVLSLSGGTVVFAGWLMLGLLGHHWRRSTSTAAFRAFLLGLLLAVMLAETSGRLWFGWVRTDLADNTPDSQGIVRQWTPTTCGPCAVAMWLHRYAIPASEGEIARLARASPLFGTRELSLAWALEQKLGPGYGAVVLKQPYEAWQSETPFIGFIHIGKVGVHAVLIDSLEPDIAVWLDPLRGERVAMPRSQFETLWRGRGILLSRDP